MTRRPLAHIRVLDFGHYLPGPLAGMPRLDPLPLRIEGDFRTACKPPYDPERLRLHG